jgi:hypothetical protein
MTDESSNSTKRTVSRALMALATCLSLASLFVAATANAGVLAQTHPFKVGGTIFSQGVSDKTGDAILDKDKFNEKQLGANCIDQEKLGKGEQVVLVINDPCGPNVNDNVIQVVGTVPDFEVLATIGTVDFDLDRAIDAEKNGVTKTVTLPATIELACAGMIDVDVEASAVATVKLDKEGFCFSTLKMKNAAGTGTVDGIDVILDKLKAGAKKPRTF